MDNEGKRKFDRIYSQRVRAGRRRTYFFDVRETKGGDYYVTLTESTKKFDQDGYERHKLFLYKEDFNKFLEGLEDVINHVKTELMPGFDYDKFSSDDDDHSSNDENNHSYDDDSDNDNDEESEASSDDMDDNNDEPEIEDDLTW